MTEEQYIADLKVMIEADKGHLAEAIEKGWAVEAHRFLDAIMDNSRILEDLDAEDRNANRS